MLPNFLADSNVRCIGIHFSLRDVTTDAVMSLLLVCHICCNKAAVKSGFSEGKPHQLHRRMFNAIQA